LRDIAVAALPYVNQFTSQGTFFAGMSRVGTKPTCSSSLTMSASEGILLQKSFWGGDRKFLKPLMRFTRGEVRDHIASSKIDHAPP
jgi:hypothetical protein